MRVAIVVPAWNVAPWIGDALASVLAQSHPDWSVVVVDDGSTDGTAERVARLFHPRVTLLRQANAGVAAARNRGLAAAGGDAVLFLDADDWLAPGALASLADALDREPGAVAAAAPFSFVPEWAEPGPDLLPKGRMVGSAPVRHRSRPAAAGNLLPRLLERNLFANGGHVLIRRAALDRVGGFRPDLAYGEDWECWCRLALLGPFAAVPGRTPALFVRQRVGGATLRMASDPASFVACMDAVFGIPGLRARFGDGGLAAIRRRTEAENRWIIGRELVRHGRVEEGRAWLRGSAAAKPSLKRLGLLAASHALGLLPARARGPFRPYGSAQPTG